MLRKHPYLLNAVMLLSALILSVALGAVYIPPGTILSILAEKIAGMSL